MDNLIINNTLLPDVEFTAYRTEIESKINDLLIEFEQTIKGKAIIFLNDTFNRIDLNAIIISEEMGK